MPNEVSYEVRDGIARVAIANGKANALSPAVVAQLDDALTRAEDAELAARAFEDFLMNFPLPP